MRVTNGIPLGSPRSYRVVITHAESLKAEEILSMIQCKSNPDLCSSYTEFNAGEREAFMNNCAAMAADLQTKLAAVTAGVTASQVEARRSIVDAAATATKAFYFGAGSVRRSFLFVSSLCVLLLQ
jgi:hypothetical protein